MHLSSTVDFPFSLCHSCLPLPVSIYPTTMAHFHTLGLCTCLIYNVHGTRWTISNRSIRIHYCLNFRKRTKFYHITFIEVLEKSSSSELIIALHSWSFNFKWNFHLNKNVDVFKSFRSVSKSARLLLCVNDTLNIAIPYLQFWS